MISFALVSCISEKKIVFEGLKNEYVYCIEVVEKKTSIQYQMHPMCFVDETIVRGVDWNKVTFVSGRGLYYSPREKCFGFTDTMGRMVTMPVFDEVVFDNKTNEKGLFPVRINAAWGVIDTSGGALLSCAFDEQTAINYCLEFSPGWYGEYVVVEGRYGKMGISERSGKMITRPNDWLFDYRGMDQYGLFEAMSLNKDGDFYINKRGKMIMPPKEGDEISLFSLNLSLLKRGTKYGFVNNDGKVVVEPKYDWVDGEFRKQPYHKNLIKVREGDKYGLVNDSTGCEIVAPRFLDIDLGNERLIPVILEADEISPAAHGCLNDKGKEVIQPIYSGLIFTCMSDDRLVAKRGDRMGVIDSRDGIVLDFVYDSVSESLDLEEWINGIQLVSRYRSFFNAWRGDTVFYIGADGKQFPAEDTVLYVWDSVEGWGYREDVMAFRRQMSYVPIMSRYSWTEQRKNWIGVSFANPFGVFNSTIMLMYGHYSENGTLNLELGVGYRLSNELGEGWTFSAGYNIWRCLSAGCMMYKGNYFSGDYSGIVAVPYLEIRPLWFWENIKYSASITIMAAYDIPFGSLNTMYKGGLRIGCGMSYEL